MKRIKLIKLRFGEFLNLWKVYGLGYALPNLIWWICFYLRPPFAYSLSSFAMRKKTDWLDEYVGRKYRDIIERYQANPPMMRPIEEKRIWFFWGQGEGHMPPVIRACYRQLTSFNQNVVLLTNRNLHEYIMLPAVVYNKVNDGRMTWAHFSDIVRNTLLANHGGLWLDATVWVSGELPMQRLQCMDFFTANGSVPPTRSSVRFWTSYQLNWSTWCLWAGKSHQILFSFVSEMLQSIAQREECWPDYVIQDYLINFACRKFPIVRNDMEKAQEWRCNYRNELALMMNQPYDENKYYQLIQSDFFFKLSFRTNWKCKTGSGKTTFYGRLIDGIL